MLHKEMCVCSRPFYIVLNCFWWIIIFVSERNQKKIIMLFLNFFSPKLIGKYDGCQPEVR